MRRSTCPQPPHGGPLTPASSRLPSPCNAALELQAVQHQQPRHHTKLTIGLICLFVSHGTGFTVLVMERRRHRQSHLRSLQRAFASGPSSGRSHSGPKQVVAAVQARVPHRFTTDDFQRAWKTLRVRPATGAADPERTDERYCTYYTRHRDYGYRPVYVEKLVREAPRQPASRD
jgi:hypothetical protein